MSQSKASRLLAADNAAITTNAVAIAFNECSLAGPKQIITHDGHRGTRQRWPCRSRIVSQRSMGNISGFLGATEIDWLLPRAIGTTGASPWIPGESLTPYYYLVDKVAAIYLYNNMRITGFEISGQETQYLNWNFALAGELETVWGVAFPSTPVPACDNAFLLADAIFNYASTAYKIQSFRLSVDNVVDTQQYENSITPTRYEATDLRVRLSVQCAFRSDTIALYDAALAGGTGFLSFTDGTTTYTFNVGQWKYTGGFPSIPGQGRINMPLTFEGFRTVNTTGLVAADNQLRIVKT